MGATRPFEVSWNDYPFERTARIDPNDRMARKENCWLPVDDKSASQLIKAVDYHPGTATIARVHYGPDAHRYGLRERGEPETQQFDRNGRPTLQEWDTLFKARKSGPSRIVRGEDGEIELTWDRGASSVFTGRPKPDVLRAWDRTQKRQGGVWWKPEAERQSLKQAMRQTEDRQRASSKSLIKNQER